MCNFRVFAIPKKKPRPRSTVRARAMLCPVVSKHFYNVRTREVDPTDVRHDARSVLIFILIEIFGIMLKIKQNLMMK